jgi:DNA ligase (NAD+)
VISSELLSQYLALKDLVTKYASAYYVRDEPLVPDGEYDKLFRQLRDLESANPSLPWQDSPTRRVGGAPLAQFEEVKHQYPMRSIDSAMDASEAQAFKANFAKGLGRESFEDLEYYKEPKYAALIAGAASE